MSFLLAFIWRHKILEALQIMTEAVVPIPYKENHNKGKGFSMPCTP